ncbi:hypothetical protein LJ756_14325 [Arthrobacter sp. zg-Y411]|uniref:hypothetical protein n=1 Tax=Arthrobacter TaxID=1663 RepID=UPI001D135F6F|nr:MULTISPECIES: hypothetical protein [Arthrobacter]MCC3295793.1 hypothetical protein [Arthrobacter zhangbolii]MDN3906010.1 hypothetical protein [Arthrobacter sp. YD2]
METAPLGHTARRYTQVQRDNYQAPICAECNRRMVPNWLEDRGRWIIRSFQYPGVRCSAHERRVLPEYFGLTPHNPSPGLSVRRDSATSARRGSAGSRFPWLGAKRAQRGIS